MQLDNYRGLAAAARSLTRARGHMKKCRRKEGNREESVEMHVNLPPPADAIFLDLTGDLLS